MRSIAPAETQLGYRRSATLERLSDHFAVASGVKVCWVVAMMLTALLLGTSFSHTLEMPAKMSYDGALYVTLQKTLYVAWGPPHLGGFLEPAALLAVALLTFLLKRRRPAVYLALTAMSLLLVAFPVVFFLFVEPANAEFRRMAIGSLPSDWMRWRAQWEYGHAARFVLHLSGFCLLVTALLSHLRRRSVRAARS